LWRGAVFNVDGFRADFFPPAHFQHGDRVHRATHSRPRWHFVRRVRSWRGFRTSRERVGVPSATRRLRLWHPLQLHEWHRWGWTDGGIGPIRQHIVWHHKKWRQRRAWNRVQGEYGWIKLHHDLQFYRLFSVFVLCWCLFVRLFGLVWFFFFCFFF